MAIAYSATNSYSVFGYQAGPTTHTFSFTCSGTNRLLVLTADIFQDVGGTGTITAASYGGVAMTKVTNTRNDTMATEIWYIAAPLSGANTISFTVTGATNLVKAAAVSYTGADQSSPLDSYNTATGSSGSPTVSVVTTVDSGVVVTTLHRYGLVSCATNRTSFHNNQVNTIGASSYQLSTTAGTYSNTYTGADSQNWSMITAAFKPSVTAATSIEIDSTSSSSATGATTLSWSHTCAGTNRILIVGLQVFDDTNDTERTVASVTYNGVALTRIDRQVTSNIASELWRLVAPATGTNTILVTLGAANDFSLGQASSYTGVDQSSPINASNKATSSSTMDATVNVTSTVNNCVVVDSVVKYNTTEAITAGSGQTTIASLSVGSGFGLKGASSYETKATAGVTTMNWTWTTTVRDWAIVAAALTPAGSTAITRDSFSSTTGAAVSSLTWSHTVAGSDRILIVAVQVFDDTSQAERTVSSVTYNGDALTRIDRKDEGNIAAELWYRIAPDTGTNNVVVTLGAANDFSIAGATSFTGVDQTNPINVTGTASGGLLEASVAVTTLNDSCMAVDSTVKYATNETLTVGSGQTSNYSTVRGSGFGIAGASSYELKTTAGAVTMNHTWTVNDRDWAMVVAALAPAGVVTYTRSQDRFVFRNDNGTETGASNIAAINTNITRAKGASTRLRFTVETTGDAPSASYQIEYRKVGDTDWNVI